MTLRRAPPARPAALAHVQEPLVTPVTVAAAPELAVLALLDHALDATRLALLAAQPSLIGEPPPWRVTTELRAATRVLRATLALERAVADYRRAVFAVLHDDPGDDPDVPF